MSDKSYPFLQKISIDGQGIDMNNVRLLAYTEYSDLSGPTIILELRDEQSIIRDVVGLKTNSIITLEMGDVTGVSNEFFEETFTVLTMPIENGMITIEGFQKECHELKQPSGTPRFFTNMEPSQILAELLPTLKVVCNVSGVGTYHLNQGKSPSRLIRNMARDFGATCYIARGSIYLIPLSTFNTGDPVVKMGINSPNADTNIDFFNRLSEEAFLKRLVQKNYASWITTKGYINSNTHEEKESVLLAYPTTTEQLANQTLHIQPKIDVVTIGNTKLMPCSTVDIEIVKLGKNSEIDESIDRLMGIQTITHYAKGSAYNNRIVFGVISG